MFNKLVELLKSKVGVKKVCIFFSAFALTVTVMGGNLDGFNSKGAEKMPNISTPFSKATILTNAASVGDAISALENATQNESEKQKDAEDKKAKSNDKALGDTDADKKSDTTKVEAKEQSLKPGDKSVAETAKETSSKKAKNTASLAAQPGGFVYSDKIPMSRKLQEYTYNKCVERGLEYELVLAIMWRESRFTINAVHWNSNGTRDNGIMQINDVNRKWLREHYGIENLMDPYQNIDAGTAMLGELTAKYGPHNALLAYQFGEGGMAQKLKQGYTTSHATEIAYDQREIYRELV